MIFLKNNTTNYSDLADKELVAAIVSESDRELLRRMQEVLYDRYAEKIFAKCVQMVRDKEVAKDLSHDIIVKLLLQLDKFRGESSFYSWVYAITYNHCLTYLSQEKKWRKEDLDEHNELATASDELELEHKVLQELQLTQLEILMEQIAEGERMILLMRYQDGMSVKQIAQTLSMGESAIKMRLKRSRDHLAELFKENHL